jgi:DNA-binding MarR family transcriptional regulator
VTSRRRPAIKAAATALGEMLAVRRRSSMAWLRACDISLAQIHVVSTLHERGPMTVGAVAEALDISAPSVTGIVDRMVERGMVERVRAEDDRRTVRVSLSESGRAMAERIYGEGAAEMHEVLAELSDDDLAEVTRLALLLRDAQEKVGARRAALQGTARAAG